MDGTAAVEREAAEDKAARVGRIVAGIDEAVPAGERQAARGVVEAFLRGVSAEDIEARGDEALGAAALALYRLARDRRPGQAELRLYNPRQDEDRWTSEHTAIDIVNDDMPFLVDSIAGELASRDLEIHFIVHPQLRVRREDGVLAELVGGEEEAGGETASGETVLESLIHIEVDRLTDSAALVDLETEIRQILADIRAVVSDWPEMRRAVKAMLLELDVSPPPVPEEEVNESREFLSWIDNHHFTYLGYADYFLEEGEGHRYLRPMEGGLGLLRKPTLEERAIAERPLPPEAAAFLDSDRLVRISKSSRRSKVHRHVHVDSIAVKRYVNGEVAGEHRLVGLFTSMAYSITASRIPLVRKKVDRVVRRTGFLPASHDFKSLRHIVENYPRDELFQISEEELYRFALRILDLQLRPRLALLLRRDEAERFVSCMVYVPRDRHSTLHRRRIQAILEEELRGEVTAFYTRISDRPLAQLHFIVKIRPGDARHVDVAAVETRLAAAIRLWSDDLKDALAEAHGEEEGLRLWRLYRNAFPAGYQEQFDVATAVHDIDHIETVRRDSDIGMRLYRRQGAVASRFHFRTFELAVPVTLSVLMPKLEDMGLEVISEIPYEVRPTGAANPVWVRDFELTAKGLEVDPDLTRERFQEAFARVWHGEVESDGFNRLVLAAGLTWRQVVVLRAYCKYLRQTGIAFSQQYMEATLAAHPRIARLLVELFEAHFDPDFGDPDFDGDREARAEAIGVEIEEALDRVSSRDEDRILRRFLNLVEATLRTNYFQVDDEGEPKLYLSLKLASRQVRELPKPRPLYEIWIYSPRTEAVHLRSGKVARGGIRWSDRREDFRTEILGLVKSQIVKNAVIVPMGAKGGFVVKRLPAGADRDQIQAEGVSCYKTMIRGLLDVTDNLVDGAVVTPDRVVRRDDDDPYLVVAADKGTASFSDIANRTAAEYDFWLGDAFASGGSHGYDHKKMGITARGAWESVKRHFREMGVDVQTQDFTAVGVGDMSGDVFGNGMLLSRHTKLVAAFNHMHVFVDPDPDPARSFAERERLFALPRSTWADYDPEVLSPGGAVFSRQAKQVTVSPEVQALLDLPRTTLPPAELIRAILRARVDLLWFGGIGTYVKASFEGHGRVGDRANDDVRVAGAELRVKVIGEGANLAVTQAGRVEVALRGGRLNTDFIDNSGGVDCSDHEVNIKIALGEAVKGGQLDAAGRNRLLEEMTEDVAQLVLHDNYLQTQAITLVEAQSPRLLSEQQRFIRDLERMGRIDRRLEGLPDETTLAERAEARRGLTRPEIAVLLAHAKMQVYEELLDSDLPEDERLVEDLVRYFPPPMRTRFRDAIAGHRLRREIIATHVTNSMVNRVGPTFMSRMVTETGRFMSEVARAYTAARDVFDLRSLWEEIEELDAKVGAEVQIRLLLESVSLLERATRWFLRHGGRPLDVAACVRQYGADVLIIAAQLEEFLPPQSRNKLRRQSKSLGDKGVPVELAKRVVGLRILPAATDVSRTARASEVPVEQVGKVYFMVGERFDFDRLQRAAESLALDSPWDKAAVGATVDDLIGHQAELTRQVVSRGGDGKAKAAIEAWTEERRDAVARIDRLLDDFVTADRIDLSMLVIAERELRRLVQG